ncbi:uncharacterized protein LOC110706258 isoform X2 [Chenopodium quinoa]|uniref:uncharacterized protein LOC110706258 isoform X2 n=1 Tax=Chenopodium quinoa TaxID=63459 RepID=UPI000B78D645|nr:uncharacterized protein LOC110706258 isoform X2 [Chenopodium quinoa]
MMYMIWCKLMIYIFNPALIEVFVGAYRHLETSVCSKLQWKLFAHMENVALFLVREVTHFNGDLVPEFCAAVFNEYTQLLNAQCIQGTTTEEQEEFVKFVSNCTSKCRSACKNIRVSVAMHLYRSADNFFQGEKNMDSKSDRGDESVVAEVKNSSDKPAEEANDKQKCSLSNLIDLGDLSTKNIIFRADNINI